jgi:NAD(P)-dependent dehydrogenase (short-subunit alcohol dehydrogenase family)
MDFHLDGKLALVSGSTAGIGFAIANALAQEGARIIVNGRSDDRVKSAMERIRKDNPKAQLEPFAADLGGAAGAEEALRRFPEVDVLVNNLGIFEPKPFEEISDAEWLRFFEVNVMSGVRLSRAYLPRMKERNWGRIVFISSESGLQIPAEMIHLRRDQDRTDCGRARDRAETCAGTGVTCNAVLPRPDRVRRRE